MKRSMVLGVLLAVGALSIAIAAQQPQPQARVVDVEKLKDNLYVLKGRQDQDPHRQADDDAVNTKTHGDM